MKYFLLGSCALHSSGLLCLTDQSTPFSESKCYWDSKSQTCYFHEQPQSLINVVYISIFASILSIPIIAIVEFICFNVLSASVAANKFTAQVDTETGPSESMERHFESLETEYDTLFNEMNFARNQMTANEIAEFDS